MDKLRAFVPAYLTAFVLSCAMMVGFILGVITTYNLTLSLLP